MPHCLLLYSISIHAPTKGATEQWSAKIDRQCISIHAPTKGATKSFTYCTTSSAYFNPRSHEGSDPGYAECHWLCTISIHAPTKGATDTSCRIADASQYFNPRSHEGSDRADGKNVYPVDNFNPRSHEGSDRINIILPLGTIISIHAPTKGATHLSA